MHSNLDLLKKCQRRAGWSRVLCARKHILILCSLSVHTPSGLSPDTPLAGCSISHAWLPRADRGNECKMPSWLKMRIITGVVRWAPTAASCHLTAHSSLESLVCLSLFLLTTHSCTSATFHTHTHREFLIRKKTLLILCFSVIRAVNPYYICMGLNLLYPCVALTWEHEIWQAHQTWIGSLIYI